jgi:RNA polymerase sigma-70 factor (sigma-E family)
VHVDATFDAFVAARSTALLRLAYLLTGDQYRAEDLVQEALVKVGLRWHRIGLAGAEAYARRVLVREHATFWRRLHNRREVTVAALPDQVSHTVDLDLRLVVRQALAHLTVKQRAVLVLRYFEDLPEGQVAELMNCSVGTVRSQTARALARLRVVAPELDHSCDREVRP